MSTGSNDVKCEYKMRERERYRDREIQRQKERDIQTDRQRLYNPTNKLFL